MSSIRTVCVYCGAKAGTDPAFVAAARDFGKILANNGVRLVYGGGALGLMGALAVSVIGNGGEVTGVIPEFLSSREKKFMQAQEIVITRDMHERKQIMFERADAFVALPGGIGTLEETVEQITWAQLGRHRKPILLVNVRGFWNPLIELISHMDRLGFMHSTESLEFHVCERIEDILPALRALVEPVEETAKEGISGIIERM
jgi:uncharacterized protein (TIGR00730 family)